MIKGIIICSKNLSNSTIFVNYVIDSHGLECPNYSRSQLDPTMPSRLTLNHCPPPGAAPALGLVGCSLQGDQRGSVSPEPHERGARVGLSEM